MDQAQYRQTPTAVQKPVIYLYPTEETQVEVGLELNGMSLATHYPKMDGGRWTVVAKPDGTLSLGGKEYGYLFWDAVTDIAWDMDEGRAFCVPAAQTAAFLEESLSVLGLSPRERNDFIVYWLPKMAKNPYNMVRFLTTDYTDAAALHVSPKPDSVIRVFMVFKRAEALMPTKPPALPAAKRSGFAVVEWGGSDLDGGNGAR